MSQIWLIDLLPASMVSLLGPISLIIVGLLVEKYYTGRITLFTNAIALVLFFQNVTTIPIWIIWYINIATVLGVLGLISYAFKFPLIEQYYHIGTIFSSAITGLILLTNI